MGDYEHFLKHKDALTKEFERAILDTLNNMTHKQIMGIPWFNHKLWTDPNTLHEMTENA